MDTIIENETLTIRIQAKGAELIEILRKDLSCSYLWHGDKKYWGGHSPLLFPMVCSAMNQHILVGQQRYPLSNHGFARNLNFERTERSETSATFQLRASEQTLQVYPFKFSLTVHYILINHGVFIEYRVQNLDQVNMPFQIGTHPAFNCPIEIGHNFADYYVEFDHPEDLERYYISPSNLLIPNKKTIIGSGVKQLQLTRSLFEEGTLIFDHIKSRHIELKSNRSPRYVALTFNNMHQLGIWQPKDAPFVCIEPWQGMPDFEGYSGEFKDRIGTVSLPKGETFRCSIFIEAH